MSNLSPQIGPKRTLIGSVLRFAIFRVHGLVNVNAGACHEVKSLVATLRAKMAILFLLA
jgi:hypothetical protein